MDDGIVVILNGSDRNPWHRFGLKANPFPIVARAEAATLNRVLRSLDAEPIRDEHDLRARLAGCTPEFIEGCVRRFVPGERVSFTITWPNMGEQLYPHGRSEP